MSKKQKGFSLIELLIVVAIILIIAAIAIPNLLKARIAANQSSAVGTLRTVSSADVNFWSTYGVGYASTLIALGGPAGGNTCANASMIDPVLSATGAGPNLKSGYNLTYAGANAFTGPLPAGCAAGWLNFSAGNQPVSVNTGTITYCIGDSGVVRYDPTGGVPPAVCDASALIALQ